MNLRFVVQPILVATLALSTTTADAHDPREFDRIMNQPKPVPTTCLELADIRNFSNDAANPDVATLKAVCDAQSKTATKKAGQATAKPAPGKIK